MIQKQPESLFQMIIKLFELNWYLNSILSLLDRQIEILNYRVYLLIYKKNMLYWHQNRKYKYKLNSSKVVRTRKWIQ